MIESGDITFLQCRKCGKIYSVERKFNTEDYIVENVCLRCGHDKALNLGEKEEDIYLYYDNSLDERQY